MRACIKYKAHCDKKTNASKLEEGDYVYVLQQKVDIQGSKGRFTDLCSCRLYMVDKTLPINN